MAPQMYLSGVLLLPSCSQCVGFLCLHNVFNFQTVQSEFNVYEEKLQTLTRLCTKDLGASLTDGVCISLLKQTNDLKGQLKDVRLGCTELRGLLKIKNEPNHEQMCTVIKATETHILTHRANSKTA